MTNFVNANLNDVQVRDSLQLNFAKSLNPISKQKMQWGLVTYAQALLRARCIRGDLEEYPAFYGNEGVLLLVLVTLRSKYNYCRQTKKIASSCQMLCQTLTTYTKFGI